MISWSDRVLIVGMNGSGKSELGMHLFNQLRVRRVLVDPKADWQVEGSKRWVLRGQTKEHAQAEVEGIDWEQPIVHVQPGFGDRPQLEALYGHIDRLVAPLNVFTDEGYMTTTGAWAPTGFRSIQATGRSRGYGSITCSQRPVDISVALRSEAQHVIVFRDVGAADLADLVSRMPYVGDFDLDVEREVRAMPQYGFMHFDKTARNVQISDPLPLEWLGRGPIRKAPGR